ncbi:MAG: LOG family protein [Bacteroidia bacterium]|nr:MAG: LOG family protein [Bacteroidia bacterium]
METNKMPKAYENEKFLTSPAARELRILSEYLEPKSRLRRNKVQDTVVFFGSARTLPAKEAQKRLDILKASGKASENDLKIAERNLKNSRYYEDAVELSRRLTKWAKERYTPHSRFIVSSGGGPGIMEAANKGAKLAGGKSIGFGISLPFEQSSNPYIDESLNFEFHYFFMRKLWLIFMAKAFVIFPGGFGTLDELMEVLTLVQTEKVKKELKIILYDSLFWNEVINIPKMAELGVISPTDLKLFKLCNSVDEMEKELIPHLIKVEKKSRLLR